MSDLISRQDAIDAKAEFLNPNVKRETEEQTTIDRAYAKGWNDCNSHWIDGIENLPSAETEIIRCKDCKYFHNNCGNMFCINARAMFDAKKDSYCSYGERREE